MWQLSLVSVLLTKKVTARASAWVTLAEPSDTHFFGDLAFRVDEENWAKPYSLNKVFDTCKAFLTEDFKREVLESFSAAISALVIAILREADCGGKPSGGHAGCPQTVAD